MQAAHSSPSRMTRAVVGGAALAVAGAIGLGIAFLASGGRLGCPSQAELERPRSADEVVARFAQDGIQLRPTPVPPAISAGRPEYRYARVYRYTGEDGAIWAVVCRRRCEATFAPPLTDLPAPQSRQRRIRQTSFAGNNLVFVFTGERELWRRLLTRSGDALADLDSAPEYGSRCYVN